MQPRRPGAVTTAPAAPSTPRPRRCSPPSPTRRPDRRRTARSNPATCSAAPTRCTSAPRPTTSAGCAGTSPRSTQAVLAHAFATATKAGRPLDPPLLVVLDEAAHIAPLPELDGLAATCASHGIQIVTVWQDLAQVRGRYGARAPTVLNNHRAKLFLPGIADPDTLEYASRLIGDEEATHPSVTRDPTGRRSTTSTTARAGCCRPRSSAACPGAAPCSSTGRCRRRGCSCGRGGRRGGGQSRLRPAAGPRDA